MIFVKPKMDGTINNVECCGAINKLLNHQITNIVCVNNIMNDNKF